MKFCLGTAKQLAWRAGCGNYLDAGGEPALPSGTGAILHKLP